MSLSKHDEWRTGPKQNTVETLKPEEIPNIQSQPSILGPEWTGIFQIDVDFNKEHYTQAMHNLILNPNINSTVILRSDVVLRKTYSEDGQLDKNEVFKIDEIPGDDVLFTNKDDTALRRVPLPDNLVPSLEIVRRMVPRNPNKDHVINQSCSIMKSNDKEQVLVTYTPHIDSAEQCPFYLPPVKSIGIFYDNGKLSIHYLPFDESSSKLFQDMEPSERPIRIAYRLLQTSKKHSIGVQNGYQKRVNHDQVVTKEAFQDTYIMLKQKYAKLLVDQWQESTDPRKHVFEDIAIAAFLIELWKIVYPNGPSTFQFRDLGCGNGILVYILIMEGYSGEGIDARERKSWSLFPENVQTSLKEQVIIPSCLLRPHPLMFAANPDILHNGQEWKVPIHTKPQHQGHSSKPVQLVECYTSEDLLNDPKVCTTEFAPNTFIIGNHSDELTCWLPLLGYPFMVIPCCSHNLNGDKIRFTVTSKSMGNSKYQGLCEHVEQLSSLFGWDFKREMLRIPSTRNTAIIGYQRAPVQASVFEIMAMEGGANKWIENTMSLMKKPPRNH